MTHEREGAAFARRHQGLGPRIAGKLRTLGARAVGTTRVALDSRVPIITYYNYNRNWGDALNPVLVRHLSGREPVAAENVVNFRHRPVFSVIGSILGNNDLPNVEVWGSGFIGADRTFQVAPRRIHAVRGPLTREVVLRQGIDCPEVYGDPALLYPRFHTPRVAKEYDLGIVAHYVDRQDPWLERAVDRGSTLLIDVLSGVEEFVNQLARCRSIASSSLHGIIAADAYSIPFTWINLSDRVLGDGFKFRDYYRSTRRDDPTPLKVTAHTSHDEIFDSMVLSRPDIDLEKLLRACPFAQDGCPTST